MEERLFDLTIFAGEGGEGGAADGQQAGAQAAGTDAAEDAGADAAQDAARREAFETSYREYNDLYQEKFKQQLDRRMKTHDRDMQALKGQNAQYQNLAMSLANRYGVDPNDLDGIAKAVNDDQSWLEEQAARNGLTVEQQRHMNTLAAENSRYKAQQEEAERQQRANEQLGKWHREAEALKSIYPDFDLDAEVQNADFADLLGKGVPMQAAYQVVHMDDIMTQGMQYAVQRGAAATAASVRANGLRPAEGAGRNTAPTKIGLDVTKLTREQREDLKKRAARGEEIGFG